jgi:hypothetical protein
MSEPSLALVADVLREAGWSPGRRVDDQAVAAISAVQAHVGRNGARLEAFDAAVEVLTEFCGLLVLQDGPGTELRRRPFAIDPTDVAACAEPLADLGRSLGARLFPIGLEGDHDSILAVDDSGRVFALDHAGVWFLGDSIGAALITLITGSQPPRLDDDGSW